jgi:divalent metal cation (Fe/Co/Zn/Cd) transporter
VAALLGLFVALIGIFLSQRFGWHKADGMASVVIGFLLVAVAIFLIVKCKALLVGEGAEPETLREIRRLVHADPDVERAGYPFTMYFGPHTILLTMNVEFRGALRGEGIEAAIDRVEASIRHAYPDVTSIFLEVDSLRRSGETTHAFPV